MQREIKFRVWDNVDYMTSPFTLRELMFSKLEFTTDCPIMQFTGLQDSKATDIYEGDIISFGRHTSYTVVFQNACFYLYHTEHKDIDGSMYRWGPLYRVNELQLETEVIGNIYENKDLFINKKG